MLSEAFEYDPEEASFYPMSAVVRRDLQLTSVDPVLSDRSRLPLVKSSSNTLLCFTSAEDDDDEEEDSGNAADNWQRLHPTLWSNEDVLDVIFYAASRSPRGLDSLSNLRGENFQGVEGRDLYHMTRDEYRRRDAEFGDLLFDCIQDLLNKSKFDPPGDMLQMVESFELNNIEPVQCSKPRRLPAAVSASPPQSQIAQSATMLPKPVQDLLSDDGDLRERHKSPLNLIAAVEVPSTVRLSTSTFVRNMESDSDNMRLLSLDDDEGGCVTDYSASTNSQHFLFSGSTILRPCQNGATGAGYTCISRTTSDTSDRLAPDTVRRLTTLTAGKSQEVCPVDLRTLPSYFAAGMYHVGSLCPTPVTAATERLQPTAHKATKRKSSAHYPNSSTEPRKMLNAGKTTGCNGRHLWEFIRDLLRDCDNGSRPGVNSIIRWENRSEGIFRILDSKQVAELWGNRKRNKTMTYEKLSRALRWSRTYGFLSAVPKDGTYPKKLCFRFGELAQWRD